VTDAESEGGDCDEVSFWYV